VGSHFPEDEELKEALEGKIVTVFSRKKRKMK